MYNYRIPSPRKRKRPEVARAVAELRQTTPCQRCGGDPIDWHAEHHHAEPNRRVANLVSHGYKLEAVLAEIARCQPLCRSCHMAEDGRTAALLAASPSHRNPRAIKPCADCARPTLLRKRGRCQNCYDKVFRVGHQRLDPARDSRIKLGGDDIVEILRRLDTGESQACVGKAFGVSQKHVSRISLGWRPSVGGGEGSYV